MRRTEVTGGGVGVEMLRRRVAQIDRLGFVPMNEIIRSGIRYRAHSFRKDAEISDVLLAVRIPECEVLRIERAVRNHGLVLDQLPMLAVGRLKRQQAAATAAKRLVA